MSDTIEVEPLLDYFAFKPSWSGFLPGDGDGEAGTPPIEVKARWLASFLAFWSRSADRVMVDLAAGEEPGQGGPERLAIGEADALRSLLESLANAAETLLAFRRHDHPIDIPPSFSEVANRLFARAEGRGIGGEGLTIGQIARRLSAARSHQGAAHRPVTIDRLGRAFDLSGERLFQFEPGRILEGRRQIQAGKSHSLEELREAERRDGR